MLDLLRTTDGEFFMMQAMSAPAGQIPRAQAMAELKEILRVGSSYGPKHRSPVSALEQGNAIGRVLAESEFVRDETKRDGTKGDAQRLSVWARRILEIDWPRERARRRRSSS